MHRTALAVLLLFAAGVTVRGAYPLTVDDAATHPPGESETVISADVLRVSAIDALSGSLAVSVGLLPRVEGSIGFGYTWLHDREAHAHSWTDGWSDLTLGIKVPVLLEPTAPFALTLSSSLKLPTAAAPIGTELADFSLLAIATKTWGSLSVDVNGGYTWTAVGRRVDASGDAWFAGTALRWQCTEPLLLFLETYGTFSADGLTDSFGTVRAGFQIEFHHNVFLGAAFGTSYGSEATSEEATVGLTIIH